MSDEIWLLGATGRVGRAVAARLNDAGFGLVLVGRDRARLESIAGELGGEPRIVVGALDIAPSSLTRAAPVVVVNTIGPFADTRLRRSGPSRAGGRNQPDPGDGMRVDALASVATEPGVIGSALAGSIISGLPSGGRRVEDDRLAPARVSGDLEHLTTPDGITMSTALLPSGELIAARR